MVSPSEDSSTSSKVTLAPASAFMSGSRIVLPFSARNCLPSARKIAYMKYLSDLECSPND